MVGKTWNKEWTNGGPTEWGGAGLDEDIVNINDNYINYIQSNHKLVLSVEDLEVADTGTTGHYLTLNSSCSNKRKAIYPLPIQMPNGEIIKSTHTALLNHQDLPFQAKQAHIFPGIKKAMLSIGTFCEHSCEATFNNKSVHINNKQSGRTIMRGTRDAHTNFYMLSLTQQNNLMTEFKTPDEYFAGSAYEWKSKKTLVEYHHTSCWSPTNLGWGKSITKKHFTSWPGLSVELVQKHLKKKIHHTWAPPATAEGPQIHTRKGHASRPRSRVWPVPSIHIVRKHQSCLFQDSWSVRGNVYRSNSKVPSHFKQG